MKADMYTGKCKLSITMRIASLVPIPPGVKNTKRPIIHDIIKAHVVIGNNPESIYIKLRIKNQKPIPTPCQKITKYNIGFNKDK